MDAARKADTYRKISLGGLVIKAGLVDLDRAVLLGLLIEGAATLSDAATVSKLRALGEAAFKDQTGDQRRLRPPRPP